MKYIMKVKMASGESGNDLLKDPLFGKKLQDLLKEVKQPISLLFVAIVVLLL
jgi:hypothetical protein